jgi:lipopolysaccharide biosynthesis protein
MFMQETLARLIAIYLPQFHPIPENDAWWGKGFTEWTNVAKARPCFSGHYQPHLPADLGFYDLRVPEVREAQAELARAYGIYGFCYYHYWFNGKRMLERPFNEVLASGKPDFPFCLCWANENWTRRWDGMEKEVLIGQNYSLEDDRQHIRWLVNAFGDQRYIRIDGKPLFLVYRIGLLPNPKQTAEIWREEAHKAGLGGLYLCAVESSFSERIQDPKEVGFDATMEFQPDFSLMQKTKNVFLRQYITSRLIKGRHTVYDYTELIQSAKDKPLVPYTRFPGITPGWDNASRRKQFGSVFKNSTPERYGAWLQHILQAFKPPSPDENLIFINAWNEWAEGNHLEPCQKWGHAYLEATRQAIKG